MFSHSFFDKGFNMLDFWLPMLLLFATATIAAITARRKRDRCLKYFNREPVMILMESGKWLWGRFMAYPKAMELIFEHPEADESGITKSSYVLYTPEVDGIKKILQPPPATGTREYDRWKKEVEQIANPSLFRRFRRWIWNIFNTLRDAISQSLGMVIGTMKKSTPMGKVAGADKRAGEIGNTLLGTVPNAYEPVLEKYLSKQVVVEMLEDGQVVEFSGLLQEYSGKYLLLRNVSYHPNIDIGTPLPDRFDIIFPRNKALVRHSVA
jgi:small nuclear ribonucleoprotein (snRNP)-like protein